MSVLQLTEDDIRLLGRRGDIPVVMNAIDLHVMSSSSGEAFPNVLAEAMACGTPCISTDVGDAKEIIGNTGWIVRPRDPTEIACARDTARIELLENGWKGRCQMARERVMMRYPLQKMITRFHSTWFEGTLEPIDI
jgi:glycosyltransferase involved in cell wall biosynthesis